MIHLLALMSCNVEAEWTPEQFYQRKTTHHDPNFHDSPRTSDASRPKGMLSSSKKDRDSIISMESGGRIGTLGKDEPTDTALSLENDETTPKQSAHEEKSDRQSLSMLSTSELKKKLTPGKQNATESSALPHIEHPTTADELPPPLLTASIEALSDDDELSSAGGMWQMLTAEMTEEHIEEMGLSEYGPVITGTRRLSDTEKKNILKELISVEVDADGLLTDIAKKRWKLVRGIIKMIEELKTLHEEAVREDPGRSEVNVWASLIMAEKNGMLWKRLKTALQKAQFKPAELAKFALLVGIPPGALEAILAEEDKAKRLSLVSPGVAPHTGSKLMLNLANSLDTEQGAHKKKLKVVSKLISTLPLANSSTAESKETSRRGLKPIPLGAKTGLAKAEQKKAGKSEAELAERPVASANERVNRSALLTANMDPGLELTRRHSISAPAQDESVPHEKQLIKMANQKKLALQAKVDLKRFIIDRSLSMEIEGIGRIKTDSLSSMDIQGGVAEAPLLSNVRPRNEREHNVTFKHASPRGGIERVTPRLKFRTIGLLAGRFTAARLSIRRPEDSNLTSIKQEDSPRDFPSSPADSFKQIRTRGKSNVSKSPRSSLKAGRRPSALRNKRLHSVVGQAGGQFSPKTSLKSTVISGALRPTLPSIQIGDEYDDVGTAVRLPPLRESPLVQQNFPERFDEETSVINSIANGDTSSEIISRFISVIGEESLPPVTESNRLHGYDLLDYKESRSNMGRDTMSSFHTAVASQDDLYSSDSASMNADNAVATAASSQG
ncbi:hypothetical protein EB796_019577 [Bugula neritina]|uniref:Uncharacterized protein n=1 Tax=Bugula neritina TaxID=10212 RepID=A0A7J7J7B3_BUGNE|nr:hypothetical protein EB796_019577 [Bugula neritina]